MAAAPPTLVDRLFAIADDADHRGQALKARAFQIFLLMHVATRTLFWAQRQRDDLLASSALVGSLAACAAVAALSERWARTATVVAAGLLAIKFVDTFPGTSNHFFIEFVCVALLAFCNLREPAERALALSAVRWLTVLVLFHSGLQKLFYGTYFDGQFLGYLIAHKSTFAWLFGWLLPAEELERLRALHTVAVGTGPFAIQSPLVILVSNAVYLFELTAPAFLLWKRTRTAAVLAAIAFTFAIELGAREIMFGALFLNLLLLFFEPPINRRLLPAFALLYVVLIASRIGLLPRMVFN